MSSTYELIDTATGKRLIDISGETFMALFDLIDGEDSNVPSVVLIEQYEYHGHSLDPVPPIVFDAQSIEKDAHTLIGFLEVKNPDEKIGSLAIKHWSDLFVSVLKYVQETPNGSFRSRYFV